MVEESTDGSLKRDDAERELVRAVYAAPDEDAPRLAYAKWLRARGDDRGELIELQCHAAQGRQSAEEKRREAGLLMQCRTAILGPIAGMCDDVAIRRGFVASCRLKKGCEDALLAWHNHALWSTVAHVDCERVKPPAQVKALPSIARHARSLTGVSAEGLWAIFDSGGAPRLETLGCFLGNRKKGFAGETVYGSMFDALGEGRLLPALRRLRVGTRIVAARYAWLWPSALGQRLDLLSVSNVNGLLRNLVDGALALREWIAATGSGVALPTLELREDEKAGLAPAGWQVTLTRDERGARSVMRARYHKYVSRIVSPMMRLVQGLMQLAPDTLTRLTVEPSRALKVSEEERLALQQAVARQGRLGHASLP